MKTKKDILLCMAGVVLPALFSSCVKDALYDTPYPGRGAVVVTTDWSDALDEADIPDTYLFYMDGGTPLSVQGSRNLYPELLERGVHELFMHNLPEAVSVDGETAVVRLLSDGTVEPMPGYLFSAVSDFEVRGGDTLHVAVPMVRRICPVTLCLSLDAGQLSEVAGFEAVLSGVAGSVNLRDGLRGSENLELIPERRLVLSGTEAAGSARAAGMPTASGAWGCAGTRAATVPYLELSSRLVGICPTVRQQLAVTVIMKDGYRRIFTSDLTEPLKDLNTKMQPVVLYADLDIPVSAGAGGSISGWDPADGGNTDAH